jgi:hypothetical protein
VLLAKVELRTDAAGQEKRGTGGKGRLRLPLYLDEGLPVLELPSTSAGLNCKFNAGGLVNPEEPLESDQGRAGEIDSMEEYGLCEASKGGVDSAVSMIDGARECDDITDNMICWIYWYYCFQCMSLFNSSNQTLG